jgi:V/A-type H+-transporting ATPase subunit I
MYNVAKIWQICAVSAIFFGVISNQYFGLQLNQYLIGYYGFHWISLISFNWVTDIVIITVIAIFFGLAQITIGLILSIVNNYRKKNYKLAVAKFTSITMILFGVLAIASGLFKVDVYLPTIVSAAMAVASLVVTAALSGEEALELASLIGHPLSYARLMGFGLASVIIALLIDKAFTPNPSQGIIVFILYSVIFIVLHMLNMVVSIFEGILQGVRLNFIEFFSKFYTGGGVKFKPFHYKRKYTYEENHGNNANPRR